MELHTIGIDLGKTVFHLVGLNPCGEDESLSRCTVAQPSGSKNWSRLCTIQGILLQWSVGEKSQ